MCVYTHAHTYTREWGVSERPGKTERDGKEPDVDTGDLFHWEVPCEAARTYLDVVELEARHGEALLVYEHRAVLLGCH